MSIGRLLLCLFAVLAAPAACSGEGGDAPGARVVPPADPEFGDLEAPEQQGECEFDDDCEISCVQSCVELNEGPITCPNPLPPVPGRVTGATCVCLDRVLCAYVE